MIALCILSGICTATILAPTIPVGPTTGAPGSYYSYSTKATDSNGYQLRYIFDWGDGTTSATSLVASGVTGRTSHKWAVAGSYNIRVRARNSAGVYSVWSPVLAVRIGSVVPPANNPPATPSIPSGDLTGKSGVTYTYSTKAIDPDGNRVKFTFNWGDGTTSTTSLVSSGAYASASHSWSIAPGSIKTFDVSAKATDERGMDSRFSYACRVSIIAEKENHPPAIPSIPTGPISLTSGESGDFSTVSTDPDGDMLKYIFDWGDGSTQTDFFPSGQEVTASHSWNVPAGSTRSYSVRAICADTSYLTSRYPYWSEPLIVTVTSRPLAGGLASEVDENESDLNEVLIENIDTNESKYENVSPLEA